MSARRASESCSLTTLRAFTGSKIGNVIVQGCDWSKIKRTRVRTTLSIKVTVRVGFFHLKQCSTDLLRLKKPLAIRLPRFCGQWRRRFQCPLRVAKLKFTASECHSARFDPIHSPPRGTTKTVVFRIDTETGNTWKLDAELSKWTL